MRYAGIGSRETPENVLHCMYLIGYDMARRGHILRSGRALGSDSAFENGARDGRPGNDHMELFTAADAVNPLWFSIAEKFHPAWDRCSDYAKKLHARNTPIVLGSECDTPVDCIVCWTKDGKATGGTGQALRIAASVPIPIFNLRFDNDGNELWEWMRGK